MIRNVIILLMSVFALSSFTVNTKDIGEEIAYGLKSGNAKHLTKVMSSSVNISLLNDEGIYTKFQTELILNDFFTKNKPVDVRIMQKINSNSSANYIVFRLTTARNTFRVFAKIAQEGNTALITELRIEAQGLR